MKKVLLSLLLSLSITIPAYSAGCKYGDVVDCTTEAKKGDAEAQAYLGLMYRLGDGVTKDYKQAVKWYRKSAEQGDAGAQNNLGAMYYNGQGVTKDYKQAVKWYRKSAEQDYAGAQNNLGAMYDNGQGVAKDYKQAYMWFNIASANGYENASKNRDILGIALPASQISKAKELSEEWLAKHSKK